MGNKKSKQVIKDESCDKSDNITEHEDKSNNITEHEEKSNNKNNDTEQAITTLINEGYTMKEAKQAIYLSLNQHIHIEEEKDGANPINKLIETGFDNNMVNIAMIQCNNNINTAIQYPLAIDSISNINDNEINDDDQVNKKQTAHQPSMQCICGNSMQKVNDSRVLYNGIGATCNVCRVFGGKDETYHHCVDWNNQKHPHGFDICDQCAVMLLESMNGMCHSPKTCFYVLHLLHVMNNECIYDMDKQISIIDNYLHILEKHNDDISYEWIADRLSKCESVQCPSLEAIYSIDSEAKSECTVTQQIWNKMHCFFKHGFDTGLRIRSREKNSLHGSKCNNSSPHKIKPKLNRFKLNSRFIQLQSTDHESKEQHDIRYFKLGIMFKYGYDGENVMKEVAEFLVESPHEVVKKHNSLKAELINNKIAVLNVQQYKNEYEKAVIHFNSSFRKKYYCIAKKIWYTDSYQASQEGLGIPHILSLMVYCNYDNLQYLFSKTYRENNGRDHSRFFHLGKNLKMAVKLFGTAIRDGPIKHFYHGISDIFRVERYIGGRQDNSISIRCPLSTSSSFAVATNFTGEFKGMVIEFSEPVMFSQVKSFSCDWLSDYANEKEHLFIQNGFLETLMMSNIRFMSSNIECKQIIKALDVIQIATTSPSTYKVIYNKNNDVDDDTKSLILNILHDRLPTTFEAYEAFNISNEYSRNMISTYFESKKQIAIYPALLYGGDEISYDLTKRRLLFLFDIFIDRESACVRLDHVAALFPNIVYIEIWDVVLSDIFFERLFQYLTDKLVKNALDRLGIIPSRYGRSVSEAVNKYKTAFSDIGYELIERKGTHTLDLNTTDRSELQVVKPSCKFDVSRTCTGLSSLRY